MNDFEKILEWVNDYPLINFPKVASILKINKGNFSVYVKTKKLPDKYLKPIIEVLKKYGYEDKSTLQNVVANPVQPVEIKNMVIHTIQKSMSMALPNNSLELNPCDLQTVPAPQNEKNIGYDAKKERLLIGKAEIKPTDKIPTIQKVRKEIPAGLGKIEQLRWMRENS